MRYGVLVMVMMVMTTVVSEVSADEADWAEPTLGEAGHTIDAVNSELGDAAGCPPFLKPFPFPNPECYCPLPVPDILGVCDL